MITSSGGGDEGVFPPAPDNCSLQRAFSWYLFPAVLKGSHNPKQLEERTFQGITSKKKALSANHSLFFSNSHRYVMLCDQGVKRGRPRGGGRKRQRPNCKWEGRKVP